MLDQDEFESTLALASRTTSQLGTGEWDGACAKCHGLDGEGDIGPSIAGNATLTDPEAPQATS